MKINKIIGVLLALVLGFSAGAEQWERRTGFFGLDFMSAFSLKNSLSLSNTGGEIKFGSDFAPQKSVIFGVSVNRYGPSLLGEYGYDFNRAEDWIPGVSVSTILGTLHSNDDGNRYLTLALDLALFLKKSVSRHIIMLFQIGINHEPISVKHSKELSDLDINLYFDMGVRWYLF